MKNLRKLFALFLALCLIGSLVACEPKDDDDDDDDRDSHHAGDDDKGEDNNEDLVSALAGEPKLDAQELNYYYIDTIDEYYNGMYGQFSNNTDTYLQLLGLDVSLPLNEQTYNDTGKTWADYFLEQAIKKATADYALCNKAKEANFTLSAKDEAVLTDRIESLNRSADIYGYSNVNTYLAALYGDDAGVKSYEAYLQRRVVADAYMQAYAEGLTYSDDQIRAYEQDKAENYNHYTYACAYLSYTDFLTAYSGTYTDAENAAAREAMEITAAQLASCPTLEALRSTIDTIAVNEASQLAVNDYVNEAHSQINATLATWLSAAERKEGDIAAIPNEAKITGDDGKETTVINGYYVTYFKSKNDNTTPMSNVRHLLVKFEGEMDPNTYMTIISDEEKQAAQLKAEGYLQTWLSGAATEESFVQLVKQYSDDDSANNGGLFENIHPDSNYVKPFLDWSIDPARNPGDAAVIETDYGYHVMYYVGDSELTYRDYMIIEEMRMTDFLAWQEDTVNSFTFESVDTSNIQMDYVICPSY